METGAGYGVKTTGCTVHFVDAGVDSGAIIGQQPVPVRDDDTAETLHARIHTAEHELYPNAWRRLRGGRFPFTDGAWCGARQFSCVDSLRRVGKRRMRQSQSPVAGMPKIR